MITSDKNVTHKTGVYYGALDIQDKLLVSRLDSFKIVIIQNKRSKLFHNYYVAEEENWQKLFGNKYESAYKSLRVDLGEDDRKIHVLWNK